jgi:hypothetical protein
LFNVCSEKDFPSPVTVHTILLKNGLVTLPKTVQKRRLNHYVKEYNHERQHKALDLETPASVPEFSTRPFPERIREFQYNPNFKIMKVAQNGAIRWKSYYWVYLTVAMKGKGRVEELGNGIWRIYYFGVFLGYFDDLNIRTKQASLRLSQNLV